MAGNIPDPGLHRAVWIVAFLNLAGFAAECVVARAIESVSLFADSIDFLEDASLNLLVATAMRQTMRNRGRLGAALSILILLPGLATLWTAWEKIGHPMAPGAAPLTITATGAMAVNLCCALLLARYRRHGGSLTTAAFLSARNDVLANAAVIAAGLVTGLLWPSAWPDLLVGLGIVAMNADAAARVWTQARQEHRAA